MKANYVFYQLLLTSFIFPVVIRPLLQQIIEIGRNPKMIKGKFMIKNHKKLVIQRQGREIQNKKMGESEKNHMGLSSFRVDQNLPPNKINCHQLKQQLPIRSQSKRNTRYSSLKSVQSSTKVNQHQQGPDKLVIKRRNKLKSCFFHSREGQEEQNRPSIQPQVKIAMIGTHKAVKQLINYLKLQGWMHQMKQSIYQFNESRFSMLITAIIREILKLTQIQDLSNQKVKQLNKYIFELEQSVKAQASQNGKKQLSINRNIFFHQYNSNQYHQQLSNSHINVFVLSQEENNLRESVQQIKENISLLSKQCISKQEIHYNLERDICTLTTQKHQLEVQVGKIRNSLSQANSQYKQIVEKQQKILNYVMKQETNKIIKLVSEDYKQIESDIYEYAVYLQSNELASSLDYEPHPFHLTQKELMEEMKNVNKAIIQEPKVALQQKYKLMRDYVLKAVDKFKKKHEQISRLCEFKTKCIKQFVNQMKKWLNNWELKQEYLVNLRKQFGADSSLIREKMQELIRNGGQFQALQSTIAVIKQIFSRIEINYMMGNSFY